MFQAEGYNHLNLVYYSQCYCHLLYCIYNYYSAVVGVGCTSTFIKISTQMKMLRSVQMVDFVPSMTYRRCFVVQTEVGIALYVL